MNLASRLAVLVSIAGLLVCMMGNALLGSGMFAFRDAAHFYYPLFQFCAEEWAAGRVPLWNPYENLGQPLAANPAASVFYPAKLIFALPISYAWAYKTYIMGHLLLAAFAAYRLARHWQASVEAAGLCAASYAFSGNVLFTYCNVVFLVGAAWLPLALLAADRMLIEGRGTRGEGRGKVRWAVGFGVVLALMVLGGDPQMAYNAGLLAAAYALLLWIADRRSCKAATSGRGTTPLATDRPETPAAAGGGFTVLVSYVWPLVLAGLVGFALSAVQVLPSMEFTGLSDRVPNKLSDRLLGHVEPGTHSEHTYHFSVGPWRLAEYLWPNLSGRQFPVNRRWLEVIPAEGPRVWTPSLYMGLLPLLLALSTMRFRRRQSRGSPPRGAEPWDRWLSWSVVVAVLASFGWHGLGWVIHEIRFAAGADPATHGLIGDPYGGLYWLMTLLLPGYAYFRYPAKLLVVAALGLSVLAARGFDRIFAEPSDRFRRGLLWLGGLSLCGAAVAWAIRPFWNGWLSGVKPDQLFGPLDTAGAAHDLLAAFLQTALLCGLFYALLRLAGSGVRWVPVVALLISAVDLGVANRWMVVSAPAKLWQEPSKLAAAVRREEAETSGQPYRVWRQPVWIPPPPKSDAPPARPAEAPRRMSQAVRWDRDTLWPKYNLTERIPLAEVRGTMMPLDYGLFLAVAKADAERPGRAALASVPLRLAKYLILPDRKALPGAESINAGVRGITLLRNREDLPRAWIVHRVEALPPIGSHDPAACQRQAENVLYPGGRRRDLRQGAVVEADSIPAGTPVPSAAESCRVVHYDPLRVEIEAELFSPGLVVLGDQFYPGWKLQVETAGQGPRSAPILRTNRVMRGAWLPQGRHRLSYRYRPASLTWGAAISGLAWISLIACAGGSAICVARRALAVQLARRPGQRPTRLRLSLGSPCATASQKHCGAECRSTACLASSSGTLR